MAVTTGRKWGAKEEDIVGEEGAHGLGIEGVPTNTGDAAGAVGVHDEGVNIQAGEGVEGEGLVIMIPLVEAIPTADFGNGADIRQDFGQQVGALGDGLRVSAGEGLLVVVGGLVGGGHILQPSLNWSSLLYNTLDPQLHSPTHPICSSIWLSGGCYVFLLSDSLGSLEIAVLMLSRLALRSCLYCLRYRQPVGKVKKIGMHLSMPLIWL